MSSATRPAKQPVRARILGWLLLLSLMYLTVSAGVFALSLLLLRNHIAGHIPWILPTQRYLYFQGERNIWQARPDCAQYDEDLVYKPREGTCLFENAEFSTVLSFGKEGRGTDPKPEGVGIAVVGDSHAMGWGVNDQETFAAELERLSGRPVYNLAVSSYGTARELLRLQKSGLIAAVDTIVIQYCENDLRENIEFRARPSENTQGIFESLFKAKDRSLLADLRYVLRGYVFTLKVPLVAASRRRYQQESYDFSDHYGPLIATLSKYESLNNKRIIVFYSNEHGKPFRNFPVGKDRQMPHVEFVDVQHGPQDFYLIDGHLTLTGHRSVARQLMEIIGPQPLRRSSGPRPLTRSPAASAAARWNPA